MIPVARFPAGLERNATEPSLRCDHLTRHELTKADSGKEEEGRLLIIAQCFSAGLLSGGGRRYRRKRRTPNVEVRFGSPTSEVGSRFLLLPCLRDDTRLDGASCCRRHRTSNRRSNLLVWESV